MYLPLSTSENLMWHTRMENLFCRTKASDGAGTHSYGNFPPLALHLCLPKTNIYNPRAIMSYYALRACCCDLHISWKLDFANLAGEERLLAQMRGGQHRGAQREASATSQHLAAPEVIAITSKCQAEGRRSLSFPFTPGTLYLFHQETRIK